MGRLFGTDGVRGVAGELLTADLALAVGRAATAHAREAGAAAPRVLVIRDPRESGEMLEAALAAGIAAAGGEALLGGVLPTPAAPLLVRRYGLDLGVVISASHNPFQDNGIKLFGADGMKLSDDAEAEMERAIADPPPSSRDVGRVRDLRGTREDYLRALGERFAGLDLSGLDVALDCANGSTADVAPEAFRRLGATVTALAVAPDGRNINAGVGSTHLDHLAIAVREGGHDLGFAFDGDGDRVLAVDRHGVPVDGDELLAIVASREAAEGRLPGNGVAVTVMTNFGFHAAMREAGIEVATTKVGDRHVLAELVRRGWVLGGEQSGHLIDLRFVPGGDGVGSALLALEALGGRDLAERDAMRKLPQRLVNVGVSDRDGVMASPELEDAVARATEALEGRGRVLVRPSGTEPLVRVMVEAPTGEEAERVAADLVAAVERCTAPVG